MSKSPTLDAAIVRDTSAAIASDAGVNTGSMTNGGNHTGTISVAAQTDTWTFSATQGQFLLVGIGEVTGSADFTPWIRLLSPNGTLLDSKASAAAAQIGLVAPLTGTYTVLVASFDTGNDGTGDYRLMAAQLPGSFIVSPGDQGGAMTNGSNHTGTILVGDLDLWSFTATQGDRITVGMGEVTGSADFTPWIRLIAPNGAVLGSEANAAAAQLSVNAPSTGTYTVIVSTFDTGNDGSGDYSLTLAKGPGTIVISPGDQGGPMTNGSNHAGNLFVGDLDAWTFTANQGEGIVVSIGEVTGTDFTPWIRLIAPNGAVLGSEANAAAAQISINAPATGTYLVVVSTFDSGNDGSGDYSLTLAKGPGAIVISPGDQGGPMTNGSNHAGTILVGDLDAWTFAANQGDAIVVSIGEVTGSADFTPWIRLIAPNGAFLDSKANAAAAQITVNAPSTGTYLVVVSTFDTGNDGNGSYSLTLAKGPGAIVISPGDQGGPMTNGANHAGTLTVGDLDAWTFAATQGDAIVVGIGEVTGSTDFTPWIRLIAPNGAILASEAAASAAQITVNAPSTGTYLVVVSSFDTGNDGNGDYRLTLAKAPGAFTTSPGDQGGAATNGGNNTGTIAVGDLDMWSFSAGLGTPFAISIAELTGTSDFTPWIRVVAPDGRILSSKSSAVVAQINLIAPQAGTYTIIISSFDTGNDGSGDYRLVVQKAGAFVTPPGDEGGPMTNGANHAGAIVVGDLDRWTFSATQNDQIAVSVAELTGSDFNPWIRLVSPSGTILGSVSNATVAQINT
ncbi:MAG: PPC domain-containing protein, partial [Gemmatimonadaceae bacterium]